MRTRQEREMLPRNGRNKGIKEVAVICQKMAEIYAVAVLLLLLHLLLLLRLLLDELLGPEPLASRELLTTLYALSD